MYKLTLALFAFLSLVPPNLAVPKLVPDNREERKHRHTKFNGTVCTYHFDLVHDSDLSARREQLAFLIIPPIIVM